MWSKKIILHVNFKDILTKLYHCQIIRYYIAIVISKWSQQMYIHVFYLWIIYLIAFRDPIIKMGRLGSLYGINPATFLCLSQIRVITKLPNTEQIRTLILESYVMVIFFVHWFEVRGDCSFCWYWRNCWPLLFWTFFLLTICGSSQKANEIVGFFFIVF